MLMVECLEIVMLIRCILFELLTFSSTHSFFFREYKHTTVQTVLVVHVHFYLKADIVLMMYIVGNDLSLFMLSSKILICVYNVSL